MFRDFLKIFWARNASPENFCDFDEKWTHVWGFGGQKWDTCLGIFCQKPTHLGGTSPYSVSMEVPPPGLCLYCSASSDIVVWNITSCLVNQRWTCSLSAIDDELFLYTIQVWLIWWYIRSVLLAGVMYLKTYNFEPLDCVYLPYNTLWRSGKNM